jgi:hypothetical protein
MLITTWWVHGLQQKKRGTKKAYMEMDEGDREAVLALVEKHFGHLHQHQSLLLLLHDERY